MNCRFCNTPLEHILIDLGLTPPSNSYVKPENVLIPEECYPLSVYICHSCFLVQVDELKNAKDIFNDEYAYFSSYSQTWLDHCKNYALKASNEYQLQKDDLVVEIASNDGYLLQYFKEKGIGVLGVEPTKSTAEVAINKGIPTLVEYFGVETAKKMAEDGVSARLVIGNNVLAHVPDIIDFVSGMKKILHPEGIINMEFPHLFNLITQTQFDTIYHEHFSYLSLQTVSEIFARCGLQVYHADEISTHGGSLRIYAGHITENRKLSSDFQSIIQKEEAAGLRNISTYLKFAERADGIKKQFVEFLHSCRDKGIPVAAYGAAAKGNTLLNYSGIKNDIIRFVVDASPYKQGKLLPGSHIPIVNEARLKEEKPLYIIIFPWNIKAEIMAQLSYVREWGGKFVVAIPELQTL